MSPKRLRMRQSHQRARSNCLCDLTGCRHASCIYTENIAATRKAQRKRESLGKYCVAGGSRRRKLQE